MYFVYENWRADDKAVVHKGDCSFCNNGQGTGRNTEGDNNGRLHRGFKTEQDAYIYAKSLNRKTTKKCAKCCK